MVDKYDSNGDYGGYAGDFKRKNPSSEKLNEIPPGDNEESNPATQKVNEYVRELLAEKLSIDPIKHPHAARLIDQGIFFLRILRLSLVFCEATPNVNLRCRMRGIDWTVNSCAPAKFKCGSVGAVSMNRNKTKIESNEILV